VKEFVSIQKPVDLSSPLRFAFFDWDLDELAILFVVPHSVVIWLNTVDILVCATASDAMYCTWSNLTEETLL